MKKILSAVFIFAIAAGIHTEAARADAIDVCALTQSDFTALQAIQNNPALTPDQELTQELALRKQLLTQTIACAIQNAQALQTTLNAVTPATPDGAAIQAQLSGKIDDTVNFYNIESAKLNGAGISSSEAIAKEMIAWREANYVPLEGDVNNFALWSANQTLFQTAQTRLTQTQRIVAFIENAAGGNDDLSAGLKAAQSSFSDAQNDNAAAAADLTQLQPPDQSLADIQQSLQALADTYQKFSDLNKLVQTLLPTQQ
jgi:hypothetical protein